MVIGTDCILNTTYMVLMKNVRDVSQVGTLGRQLFPGCSKASTVSYTDALSVGPYSYLIMDASPHSEDKYRQNKRVPRTCTFELMSLQDVNYTLPFFLTDRRDYTVPCHKSRPSFKLYGSVS